MPNYRAYVIGPDGSFARAHNFSAADDSDARTHAERYVEGHDVELWRDQAGIAAARGCRQAQARLSAGRVTLRAASEWLRHAVARWQVIENSLEKQGRRPA
jgi:hypothetical protein